MIDRTDDQVQAVQFRWITCGFLTSGLGIALLLLDSTLELAYILSFIPQIRKLLVNPVWVFMSGSFITTLTFIGSYLLWRRWNHPVWIRNSTLLLVMNTVHLGLWLAENHHQLGLPDQDFDHEWLRIQLSQILNWSEFVVWINLIRIFHRQHTARLIPERFTQTHFGLSWSGLIFSIAIAIGLTDWPAGWPLARIRWLSPLDSLMLATASTMLTASASLQITIYLFKSSRISYLCDHLTRPAPNQSDDWYQDQWDDNPWGNH